MIAEVTNAAPSVGAPDRILFASSWRVALTCILVLAIAVRLAFAFVVARGIQHVEPQNQSTDEYHRIAENLYEGDGYRFRKNEPPTLQRAPVYPAFLVAIFSATGIDYAWVQVVQAALGALGCWLLFLLGRWVWSVDLGVIAAAMYALYPNAIEYSGRLYVENVYFPIFLAFALVLCRASWQGSVRYGAAAGLLWGLSLLTRGTLLPLPGALPIGLALSPFHRKLSRWVRWTIPAALVSVLVVAPWTVRNYSLSGAFVPVSTVAWLPIYNGMQVMKEVGSGKDLVQVDMDAGAHVYRIAVEKLHGGDASLTHSSPADAVHYDRIARDLVLEAWRSDPSGAALRAITGLGTAWFFTFGSKLRLLSLAIHLPILVLFVVGCIAMARSNKDAFTRAWPALGLVLFVNLFYAVAYPHVRYMSPAIALSLLFAALPLLLLLQRFAGRFTRHAALPT